MLWRDMEEMRYSVIAHRQWIYAEIHDSRIMQQRFLQQLGHLFNWVGLRFITWGDALRSTSPNMQIQQNPS